MKALPAPHVPRSAPSSWRLRAPVVGLATIGLVAVALSPGAASAQAIEDEFTVQRFNPAPGPRNFFTTRGTRQDGEMAFSAGLFVNYAYQPFVLVSCASRTNCDDPNAIRGDDIQVVENMVTGDVLGSLTPIPRLQIGLRIPVTWVDGVGVTETGESDPEGLSAVGMGDPELEGKFRLVGEPDSTVAVGVAAFVTGPMGNVTAEGNYIGDATPSAGLRGIFDGKEGPLRFGANLIGVWRGTGRVGSTEIGPEMRYGVAGGYAVSPLLEIVLDGFGSTKFASENGTNALEANAGVKITPPGLPLMIAIGGGTGLIQGVGVPTARGFLGFIYTSESTDTDLDTVSDDVDQCPNEAEDMDGYEDGDGCPEVDNDGDTIADGADKCPNVAEDPDGFEDIDGCPEEDNDKDGIADVSDRCPNEAETKNGYKDDDGCPDEPDSDNDGVPDAKDQCKDEPEDTDGFQDTDGCPDPDNDNDGVPDNQDECIDQPETKNGFEDQDGCPDEAP